MAKPKKQGFSIQGFDAEHIRQSEGYTQMVDALYNQAVSEYAQMAGKLNVDPSKPFSFGDYPGAKSKAEAIIKGLASKMEAVIVKGSAEQWLYAGKKNDAFLNSIIDTSKVKKAKLAKYQDRNLDALKTFQTRKVNGLGLSDRIWNYAGQMKTQMEMGIDLALGDGKSAQALSRELKQYLVDPDKLFKRVRDKHGVLQLSKNAKAYHPGQGKYRSSHKNAMRLTRSEINMAYRESDHLRWQQLDFVVGFEVKLSNNHPVYDICDIVQGKYPKDFKFIGWHPQCRCKAIPILQDPKEFDTDELNELKAAINGTEYKPFQSANTVTDVPNGFKDWIKENAERSKGWKSQPYFIKDNFIGGKMSGGLKLATKSLEQIAAEKLAAQAAKAAAAEAAKIAEAKAVEEAIAAAKAKVLADKKIAEIVYAKKKIAEAESLGITGKNLESLKLAIEDESLTYGQIAGKSSKMVQEIKAQKLINADPFGKQALLLKYSQAEVDSLFTAYDNFYKAKINNLELSGKVSKIEFEVNWLATNGKYSTSGELSKMLQRDLADLKLNFEKELLKKQASDLVSAHLSVNDNIVKSSIKDLQKVLNDDKADIAAIKTAMGQANKVVNDFTTRSIRTVSPDDFKFFDIENDKFSLTKFYTESEKAKVTEYRQSLNDAILKAKGDIRDLNVLEAQKELAEYMYKIQFKYVAQQPSIKHIGMNLDSNNEFVFDYISDKEAKAAFERYVTKKGEGGSFYSNNVGGVHMTPTTKTYTERVKKAGVDITAEATLPSRYFSGSGFINNYIKKSDFSYVSGKVELKQALHDYVSALSHSINKLPRYNGISYRGISHSKEIIDEMISCKASNKPFVHKLGMSTSITPRVADNFGTGITFKIYGKSGIYGREFSDYSSELEVLYRPGSRFEIVEIYQETANNGIARKGSWTVIIKEIIK